MRRKTTAIILTLVLLISAIPIAATTNNIRELQNQRQEASNQVRATLNNLTGTRNEMSAVMQELMALDEALYEVTQDLEIISALLDNMLYDIERTEAELESARYDLDNQMEFFRARLRLLHEHGQAGLWEVVFQATSIRDFLLRVEHMNAVAAQDERIIEDLESSEARIAAALDDLAIQVELLERLTEQQEAVKAELDERMAERYIVLNALQYNEAYYEELLEAQREDEARIYAAIVEAQRQEAVRRAAAAEQQQILEQQAIAQLNGQFLWPLPTVGPNRITSRYGPRTNPITRRSETHSGIDIGAPAGTPIVAAEAGTVILSGWNGGFGQTVIIYHGNGVSTLYAHNSRNLVTVGQRVARGERIALVGSTGMSTGPHLHFEVRINGAHTNPNPFLGL